MTQPTRSRLRIRLSLRVFMALVLALGTGLGYFVLRARDQRLAVDAIRRAGGSVVYGWQWRDGNHDPLARPGWLIDYVGPDYFSSVKSVTLVAGQGSLADNRVMASISRLRKLESLQLN